MLDYIKKNKPLLLFILLIITQLFHIRAGKYYVFVTLIFFISLFFLYKPKFNSYILFGFLISLFLTIRGLLNGNLILDILNDFLIFSPILISFLYKKDIFLYVENNIINIFTKSLICLIPLGILIFKYMEYDFTDVGLSRFNFNEDVILEYFSPIMPFLFAPYLVFYYEKLNKNQKYLLLFSLFFICFMGIITLSRSLILNLVLPFFLYFLHKFYTNQIVVKKYIFYIFILIIIGIIINFIFINNELVTNLWDLLNSRNTQQLETGNITSDRFNELLEYLKQNISILDYLIGRGFGGQKILVQNTSYIGGITMMHIGVAHVFLKGGILLIFYIYSPIVFMIFYFLKNKIYTISYLLIWFLIENTTTTTWELSYPLFFYSFSIAFLFNKIKFKY